MQLPKQTCDPVFAKALHKPNLRLTWEGAFHRSSNRRRAKRYRFRAIFQMNGDKNQLQHRYPLAIYPVILYNKLII
jgi:hypothetical protein